MADLEQAIGQYTIYHEVSPCPTRSYLFFALNEEVYANLFEEPIGELLLESRASG